ncbi:tol-pal system YbgF family protein [Nonomuraea sp. NPDC049028]|uniref:tetratricopeptide repeat protein n=1 Tax=Nonomuraea sp. NPDC049028 TaxID=3364348 RepID=UPI00371952CD
MGAVFAATVVLMGGCGGSPAQARPAITPAGQLVPLKGRGDLPEATVKVGLDCQRWLENHDFQSAATEMGRVAADDDSTDSEKAIAQTCLAAAQTSMGDYRGALDSVDAAERHRGDIPDSMHWHMRNLRLRSEAVSAAAVGEYDRAEKALDRLAKLGYKSGDYARDACAVASDPASLPACATATPSSTMTESPSDEPETPVTPQPEESNSGPTDDTTPTDGATTSPKEETSTPPDDDDDGPAPSQS